MLMDRPSHKLTAPVSAETTVGVIHCTSKSST